MAFELQQRSNGHLMTVARVRLPRPLGPGLVMSAQSGLDGAIDALGGPPAGCSEVRLGHAGFDTRMLVYASHPPAARGLLTDSPVPRSTLELMQHQPTAWANEQSVQVQMAGAVTDAGRWRVSLRQMNVLAQALSAAAEGAAR